MDEVRLSERKQKILRALVDNYITCATPVSSSEIRNNYLPEVSSATIRSEMMALEEMGYLQQPHISAGRVPSAKAYRYYVDNLISSGVNDLDIAELNAHFDGKLNQVEEVLRNTAKVISDVTNYTSVVVVGGVESVLLKQIKLVDVGDNSALVVLITDRGVIKDNFIELPPNLAPNYFSAATEMLNDIFAGKSVGEVVDNEQLIECEIEEFKSLFKEVLNILSRYKDVNNGKVYLEGTEKILEYKEYENIDNVKKFLALVNTKEKLNQLIGEDNIELSVKIGRDDGGQENMAIVSARCVVGGKEVGRAGVIGPERMDYKKVIGVLNNLVSLIDNIKE